MITRSITETRKHLGELIELARKGEEVVIIKDSRPVATLTPISDSDLQLAPITLTDEQAAKLHRRMDESKKFTFGDAESAVQFLKKDRAKNR